MSSESTDKLWCRSIDDLKKLVQEEETSESKDSTFYATLYVQYNLVLRLGLKAYDATVQVQKRIDMKLTLEHLICRIISLRTRLQSSDEIDSALISLKLSPAQLDVASPVMFKEGTSVSTRMAKLLGAAATTEDSVDSVDECRPAVDHEEHDETSITNTKSELDISSGNTDDKEDTANATITIDDKDAAAKIQALCRGRLVRKRTSDERIRLDNFVGMIRNSSKQEDICELTSDIVGIHERRVQEQRYCQESYKKELQQLKEVVLEEEGFDIQSELREERIRWVTDQTVSKHELPDSLDDFYKEMDISQTVNADDTTGSKDPNLDRLKECIDIYEQRWKRRSVGADRIKSQSFDIEMAKSLVIRNQVREELIPGVDEKLLSNLQKIKATQESDKKKKKSSKKDKGKGKGKGKKDKKKGKKEKPLPGSKLPEIKDMKVSEMLECLIENDLIHDYDQHLSTRDFIGSFEATIPPIDSDDTQDVSKLNDAPNPWQLRKAVVDACILPMGSQQIKSSIKEDEGIRSILL